jgi:hypothetical protein
MRGGAFGYEEQTQAWSSARSAASVTIAVTANLMMRMKRMMMTPSECYLEQGSPEESAKMTKNNDNQSFIRPNDERAHQERKLTAEVSAKRLAEQAAWWDKNKDYLKKAGIDFYMHNKTGCQEVRLENPSMEPTMPDQQPKSDSYMPKHEPDPPHDPLQTSLALQKAVLDYAQAIKNVKQLTQSLEEAKKTLNQRHTETMNIINTQYYKFQEWIEVQRSIIEP